MKAKTIHALESIPKATIYSKYGESLDKLFKSRSLKNLISELKSPKKYEPKENLNEENRKKKKKYTEEEYRDIFASLEAKLNSYKNEEYKNEYKKKSIDVDKFNHRKIIKSNDLMDPFKYNPNYNSISKNIPSVRMILTEKESKELQKIKERQKSSKDRKKISNLKNNNIIPKIKTRNEDSFITLLTENNKKMSRNNSSKKQGQSLPPISRVPEQKERAMTLENDYNLRNNHALRFSKYLSRKDDLNKDNVNKISYLEPYNYLNNKNNIIDFKKMAFRKAKDLINSSSLGVPSFNDYNPKYSLVEKKTAEYVFSPHLNRQNSKKYLLKKLWSSYEVPPEYQLFNNNKLSGK